MYFDPLEVESRHDADYIFITHPHFDHFSLLAILEVKKPSTVFITTKDIVEELLSIGIQEAVSYTHLDVYKRQYMLLLCSNKWHYPRHYG